MSDTVLNGLRILVTGAGSGIGQGISLKLAKAGAAVAVNDVSAESASCTVDLIIASGGKALSVPGDVANAKQAESVVSRAVEPFGVLDGLVNNAGILGARSLETISRPEWERVIAVNLKAPFLLSVLAAPYLRASECGRILNIASIAGTRVSLGGGAAYTASKSGLIGLTRHLAMELAEDGVTVNAILPGVTETPLLRNNTSAEASEAICASVPLGRLGNPQDIGALSVFLLSKHAGYISGTAIPVDGALSVLPGNFSSYQAARS